MESSGKELLIAVVVCSLACMATAFLMADPFPHDTQTVVEGARPVANTDGFPRSVWGMAMFAVDGSTGMRSASIEGDVAQKRPSGDHLVDHTDSGIVVCYGGPLWLNELLSVGGEANILIRHGGSQTEVVAEVEAP